MRKRSVRFPDGGVERRPNDAVRCAFGAECVRRDEAARAAGGQDGFVYLECAGQQCSCRLDRLGNGNMTTRYEERFALEQPCGDTNLAKRLLRDICMKGMPPPL